MIKISIIIPVYNAGKYLHDTLESVKKQTFTDWECICINDGSTDESIDMIKQFVNEDKRFKCLEQTNSGVSVARNAGLDLAIGEYIAFLDQDDLMPATALESLFVLAKKHNANFVRGKRINVPENFTLIDLEKLKLNDKYKIISPINATKFRALPRRWMYVWLCLLKKDFLKSNRFYEPLKSGAEDNIFMFEIFNKAKDLVQSQNVVCLHRKSLTSTTQNGLKLSHLKSIELAVQRFSELIKVNDNNLSRYIYKKQMRNFFRGSVYKSLDSRLYLTETQEMLMKIYPDIKQVLKMKHKIVAYFFIRSKFRLAKILKKVLIF